MTPEAAVRTVRARSALAPEVAIVLGTGLGALAREIAVEATFSYSELPGFVRPTVESHAGRLVLGTLEGLMTLAPFTDDVAVQRRTFRGLRALRDGLKEDGLWLPTLSMGMSGDYATAVEEGATVIRLGTALFGPRTP